LHFIRECNKIEDYLKICNENIINLKKIKKYKHPKISIVSPIYNRGKYLLRFIKSIQNQNFKEVEIILIDDSSTDNTKALIKKYQEDDKRIILIQNKKNKGTFASRNIGSLKSKGEYIMLPDPDDILGQDCLFYFYNLAKKNNYEMIRFYIYTGKRMIYFGHHVKSVPSRPVFQPELSTYLFYARKRLQQIDYNVSNKFIKREALIRALNYISNYILIYMINFEDGVLNYFLYRNSKSFYLKKKIAYYYIKNKESITRKKINTKDLKFIFWHLKFVFEYSKNTKYEKDMSNVLFRRIGKWRKIKERVINIKNDYDFYLDVIDKFLNNKFINNNNKIYLRQTRRNLLKAQKVK
jgi:glycosyltransferase involved in cell wall biosynthesis